MQENQTDTVAVVWVFGGEHSNDGDATNKSLDGDAEMSRLIASELT